MHEEFEKHLQDPFSMLPLALLCALTSVVGFVTILAGPEATPTARVNPQVRHHASVSIDLAAAAAALPPTPGTPEMEPPIE